MLQFEVATSVDHTVSVPAVGNGGVLVAVVGELWKHMEMKKVTIA